MEALKKNTNEFNARLVVRGDTVSEEETDYSSAPTTRRGIVSTVLISATFFGRQVSSIDFTEAFLQEDDLQKAINNLSFYRHT